MKKVTYCRICSQPLCGRQTVFCSNRCKNIFHQSYDSQKTRAIKRKYELIEEGGSKCTKCGYNKNLAALAFHHLVPEEKKFKLDARTLSNRALIKVRSELKKCVLLCHNCHSEIHNPELSIHMK
jgi:predicted nucleic acid-binding Zn ribbon protein